MQASLFFSKVEQSPAIRRRQLIADDEVFGECLAECRFRDVLIDGVPPAQQLLKLRTGWWHSFKDQLSCRQAVTQSGDAIQYLAIEPMLLDIGDDRFR